jgi:heavy metal sensor kinase
MPGLFDQASAPFYYAIWRRDGGPLLTKGGSPPTDLTAPARDGKPALTKLFRDVDGRRECYLFTPPGECLLVGGPLKGLEAATRELAWKLTALGAAVLAVGLLGGWWLVTRAIRPIGQITSAADRIATGDLTERIQTAETESELGRLAAVLNTTFAKLEAAFAEQARFTSDAAHELRTPASVILAQTQLALRKPRTVEEYRDTIDMTHRAAKRMCALVESLLELARLDGAASSLEARPCDLAEIASESLEHIRPLADERGIILQAAMPPAPCLGDPSRLAQILTNLLSNAVKFSRPGDQVTVQTTRSASEVAVSVADTGPGIAAHDLPHLFERFYRADESRNRSTGGAGLGLAICQMLAQAHGGSLSVESCEGRGSTFTLRLPIRDAASALEPEKARPLLDRLSQVPEHFGSQREGA